MKDKFPGYYKKTEEEIAKMWHSGIICFDANVLLNLYRYSDETKDELISLIERFNNRIFLPHQAALEYNRNRYEVIADQEKTYKEFISKLSQIERDLKSTSKPPFLSDKNHKALQRVFGSVIKEVELSIEKYSGYLRQDEIYDKISAVFNDLITEPLNSEELEQLFKDGEERYSNKIPPGYEDEKTKKGDRKFGDLILWKQLIRIGKEKKKPIILITDERKEDWWWKIKDGRNMGPRQELVQEMKKEAEVDFHMYSSERFLSNGLKFLKEQVNEKAVEELQEIARTERRLINREKAMFERRIIEKKNFEKIRYIDHRIASIKQKLNSLNHGIRIYKNEPTEKEEVQERIIEFSIELQKLTAELDELSKEREYMLTKSKYNSDLQKGFGFDDEK